MRAKIPLLLISLLLSGCQSERKLEETRFFMNTYVRVKAWGNRDDSLEHVMEQVFEEIARVETLTSHFNEKSLLTGGSIDHVVASEELAGLLSQSIEISNLSNGAFDPTVYPILQVWGFYDTTENRIPTETEIGKALSLVDWKSVEVSGDRIITNGAGLDLSAIAKGYAVDRAAAVLADKGIRTALIDAGGDIRCVGRKQGNWIIGIKHPRNEGLLGTIEIIEGSVATSGDYENYFEIDGRRYHHLMDPRTGRPAAEVISATVIAPTALQADAWATALFVMGKQGLNTLEEIEGLEGLVVLRDMSVEKTTGFPELKAVQ
ncbi:FAD:protein FMN transferase [candidate division WOR-3 bacterium]|uniref:FAD:protein FMN transferase n=1 Tax=candidate division WOR-3 bacterium TaxID=2052148 RepID=A0A9D5K9P7_UNCW3|nr:FAD:protein FMN transferase [candidate division WOR-3 bacterium]MBD3363861.1 FAD:protein FMN transferase [candidate division WOR-3 bacterium]